MEINSTPVAIEPDPKDTVFCLYQDDVDGFAACWVLRLAARGLQIPVEFATFIAPEDKFDGRNVIVIGNDVEGADAKQFLDLGAKSFAGISRSKSSDSDLLPVDEWKRTFPYGIESLSKLPGKFGIAKDQSLAMAAWKYLFAARAGFDRTPRLVDYINDNASGKPKYNDSEAVAACLATYDRNFSTYDALAQALDNRKRREMLIAGGQAALRIAAKPPEDDKRAKLRGLLEELRTKKAKSPKV